MKFTIKSLVIGTLSSASAAGAGFVGWTCYDNAYPTVGNALDQQGYKLSEASVPTDNYTPVENKKFNWKQWDCSSRLFPGVEAKADSAAGSGTTSSSNPNINISKDNEKDAGKAIGCAVMQMHPWTDKGQTPQSRFYLQMEVAVRNYKSGFILWTGILLGKFSNDSKATTSFDFEHRMFLLENEDGQWTVKGGYSWIDASLPTDFNVDANFLVIKTPDGYWLNKEIINTWSRSSSWAGVWEEVDLEGHHPLKDIVIGLGTNSDKSRYDAEVYGLDEAFAANNSSHPGYGQVSKYYDAANSQWNAMRSANKKDELKNWYSPFNDKKGQWTEMSKRCRFLSSSRQKLSEVVSIKDLCYQRTTDSSI